MGEAPAVANEVILKIFQYFRVFDHIEIIADYAVKITQILPIPVLRQKNTKLSLNPFLLV